MVSSLTRNQVPGNRLRVRIPCPPLLSNSKPRKDLRGFLFVGRTGHPVGGRFVAKM